MIDERKIQLLQRVVDAYLWTGAPVGSHVLVQRYRLSWSSATIRNELSILEEQGYMFQPYTSAGRVPTTEGYRFYIAHARAGHLAPTLERSLRQMTRNLLGFEDLHELCRILSHLSKEIIFAVFPEGSFTTGMRFVAEKIERDDPSCVKDILSALDAIEEICHSIHVSVGDHVHTYIGDDTLFGAACSALLVRIPYTHDSVIIGMLGPLRMNYQKNIALLQTLTPNP